MTDKLDLQGLVSKLVDVIETVGRDGTPEEQRHALHVIFQTVEAAAILSGFSPSDIREVEVARGVTGKRVMAQAAIDEFNQRGTNTNVH